MARTADMDFDESGGPARPGAARLIVGHEKSGAA